MAESSSYDPNAKLTHPVWSSIAPAFVGCAAAAALVLYRTPIAYRLAGFSELVTGQPTSTSGMVALLDNGLEGYAFGLGLGVFAALLEVRHLQLRFDYTVNRLIAYPEERARTRCYYQSLGAWAPSMLALIAGGAVAAFAGWSWVMAVCGALVPIVLTFPVEWAIYREALRRLTDQAAAR